jgi:dihydroorotase
VKRPVYWPQNECLKLLKKHNKRLHLFHISTAAEANLFDGNVLIREKRITVEACIHHLWFSHKNDET